MSEALLALDGVHGAYGPSRVLHGVSLEAKAGEVVSLLGRNGAGKSTTLKAIMSLVEVTSGAVRFDGRDITRAPTHEISRLGVGYVPEDRRIFGDLTVAENLIVGEKGSGGWTAVRVYAFFPKLGEMARRRAGSLSGGEQQMLTVARTLMGNPRLLLLDEPVAGMTDAETMTTAELLRDIARDHTVIVVEHDMEFVRRLGVKVTVLHEGSVLAEGTIDQVSQNERVVEVYLGR